MNEQWEFIERLFHAACELPPEDRSRFLDRECRENALVRAKVEALLRQYENPTEVLDAGVVDMLPSTLEAGSMLGPYEVIEVAGAGGMGHVYRARDKRLKRDVAVKALPAEFASDSARRSRFQDEATVLALFNHPNVAAIYDVVEGDGGLYLILEFVEGATLADRLRDGALPVDEVLHLCWQIALALEAAHDKGIVHRDLKPANIKVAPDGTLKVLDFGLAKTFSGILAAPAPSSTSSPDTRIEHSLISGTPMYMSPEQTRGEAVDQRADIWAFGCVMYELLTGRKPFGGETIPQTIASIQETEPDWTLLPKTSFSELQSLLSGCLQKDVNQRTQHAQDLRKALEQIEAKHKHASRPAEATEQSRRSWRQRFIAFVLLVIAGVLGLTGLGYLRNHGELRLEETLQLTFSPGLEIDPALSPDGRMLAYVGSTPTRTDIYIQQVSRSEPFNLTKDLPGFHRWPKWSPDGTMIAFVSSLTGDLSDLMERPTFVIRVIPSHGGAPRKIADAAMLGHTWSPDGKKLAYVRGREIWVTSLDGSTPHKIAEVFEPHAPTWSPDSRWIAFVSGNTSFMFSTQSVGNQAASAIMIVPADGGKPWPITDKLSNNLSPVWSPDSKSIFFVSNRDRGGSREVFQLNLSESGHAAGEPVRITSGLNAFAIDLSRDGQQLAYSNYVSKANLWSLAIPGSGPVSAAAAKPVTSGSQEIESSSVSRDGQWIAFDSYRGGQQDVFRMRRTGGDPERVTTNRSDDAIPSWSADGKFIAFHSHRNGNRDIYIIAADGTSEQQVTADKAEERFPDWSPDDKSLVFFSDKTGRQELFIVSKENGAWNRPRQLTDESAAFPKWSPDGRFIAYIAFRPDGGLGLISPDGSNRKLLVQNTRERSPQQISWSKDSQTIYFKAVDHQNQPSFWSVPVGGGEAKHLVQFSDPPVSSTRPEFSNDGSNFLFTITERESDIWTSKLRR